MDSIAYTVKEGYYYINVLVKNKSSLVYQAEDEDDSYLIRRGLLICRADASGRELEPVSLIPSGEAGSGMDMGRQGLEMMNENWPVLSFVQNGMTVETGAAGETLPYDSGVDLTYGFYSSEVAVSPEGKRYNYVDRTFLSDSGQDWSGWRLEPEVPTNGDWHLRFLPQQVSGQQLYAQFLVRDTQGFYTASNLIPIENHAQTSSVPLNQVIYARDGVTLTCTGIDVIQSELDAGLYFHFHALNESDELFYPLYASMTFDRVIMESTTISGSTPVFPGMEQDYFLLIHAEDIPPLESDVIHQIGMKISTDYVTTENCVIEAEVDVSSLNMARSGDFEVFASGREEDLLFELSPWEELYDGARKAMLRITNESTTSAEISLCSVINEPWNSIFINGSDFQNSFSSYQSPNIPVGYTAYATIYLHPIIGRIDPAIPGEELFPVVNGYAYWDIQEMHTIGLPFILIPGDAQERWHTGAEMLYNMPHLVTMEVLQEESARQKMTEEKQPTGEPALEMEPMTMTLRDVTMEGGKLRVYLDAAVRTGGGYWTLDVPECLVDGRPAAVRACFEYHSTSYAGLPQWYLYWYDGRQGNETIEDYSHLSLRDFPMEIWRPDTTERCVFEIDLPEEIERPASVKITLAIEDPDGNRSEENLEIKIVD